MGSFGENVRRMRKRANLQSAQLATATGVTRPVVSKWETNRTGLPETPTLFKIAKALHCSIEDLLEGIDQDYDAVRRDLTGQTTDQLSNPLLERGSNVPALAEIEASRLESKHYRELIAATEAAASRLFKLAGKYKARIEDREAGADQPGARRRAGKAGR